MFLVHRFPFGYLITCLIYTSVSILRRYGMCLFVFFFFSMGEAGVDCLSGFCWCAFILFSFHSELHCIPKILFPEAGKTWISNLIELISAYIKNLSYQIQICIANLGSFPIMKFRHYIAFLGV